MSEQRNHLVAVLRSIEGAGCTNYKPEYVEKACGDAADEIVRVRAQRDGAVEACDVALARVLELEAQLASARKAAERVCWFDWTGNDPDACKAIDDLRTSLSDEQSEPSGSHEQFSCLCGIGPEPCPGPDGKALCALIGK